MSMQIRKCGNEWRYCDGDCNNCPAHETYIQVVWRNGCVSVEEKSEWARTGRHFPEIVKVLEQMKEE